MQNTAVASVEKSGSVKCFQIVYDPVIPLQNIYSRKVRMCIHTETVHVFIASLFTVDRG